MANNNETTTKFKVDITELKSAIQEAKRQIKIANSEFKSVSSSMQSWEKTTDGVKAKLKQLDSNLISQKNILKSLESQYDLTAKQMGKDSAAAENLKVSINNQKAVINQTENQIKYYNASLLTAETAEKIAAQTGKDVAQVFDQLSQEAKKAGDSAKGTSDGFMVMQGALASLIGDLGQKAINSVIDLGKQSLITAMAFSKSMSEVRAISGATVESYQQLENKARECGERTIFSANESAQALNLAAASSMNLTSASELATNTMQAFGMTIDGATEKLSNGLVCAQNNCSITTNQLGEAYINSAFNINSAGQAIETTTFLLAMMENQGLKGVELGSALNAIFTDMTARIQGMKEMICSAAASVLNANGNFQNLINILTDVKGPIDAIKDVTDFIKGAIENVKGPIDAIKGVTDSIKGAIENVKGPIDAIKGVTDSIKGAIENVKGPIDTIKGVTDSIKGAIENVKGPIDAIKGVTDSIKGAIENVKGPIDAIKGVTDSIKGAIENVKGPIDAIKGVTDSIKGAIENVKGPIDAIKDIPNSIKDVIGNVKDSIKGVMENGKKIIGFIKEWTNVTKLQELAQMALNFVMNANPIGIIITVIGLLIAAFVALWNNNEDFRNFWIGLWESISKTVGEAIGAIVDFFVKTIPETFSGVIDWIKENWVHILEFLLNPFVGLFHYFYDHCDEFRKFVDNAVNFIKELPGKIWTWLVQTIDKVKEWGENLIKNGIESAKNLVGNVINFIKELPGKIWTWLVQTIDKVKEWGQNLIKNGIDAAKNLVSNVVNFIKDLPGKIVEIGGNIVKGLWDGMCNMIGWLKRKIEDFGKSILDGIKGFFGIHSPSRLMRDEIGKYIPKGIAVGIEANAKSVLNTMKNLSADLVGSTKTTLLNSSKDLKFDAKKPNVVYNFYQTNNSPKHLSRLEIYRQSKNLLQYANIGGGI